MSDETNSRPVLPRSRGDLQDSTDGSISSNSGPVARADAVLHDRTGLYLAIVAALFAAMAFGASLMLPLVYSERNEALKDRVETAERNTALAREDIRIMQQALAARGIQTDEHAQEKGK